MATMEEDKMEQHTEQIGKQDPSFLAFMVSQVEDAHCKYVEKTIMLFRMFYKSFLVGTICKALHKPRPSSEQYKYNLEYRRVK